MEYHAFQASCRRTVTALHLYISHLSQRDPSFAVFPECSNGNIHLFQEKKRPCTYFPPKSCIPRRAKMKMNRRRRKIKLRIDLMLFKREVTKLRKDAQNLEKDKKKIVLYIPFLFPYVIGLFFQILIPGIPFFQLQQQWNTYPSSNCISLPVKSLSQTFSSFSRGISRIIPVSDETIREPCSSHFLKRTAVTVLLQVEWKTNQ